MQKSMSRRTIALAITTGVLLCTMTGTKADDAAVKRGICEEYAAAAVGMVAAFNKLECGQFDEDLK